MSLATENAAKPRAVDGCGSTPEQADLSASSRGNGRSSRSIWVGLLLVGLAVLVAVPDGLVLDARLALWAFGAATVLWVLTDLDAGFVAIAAAFVATVPVGGEDAFFASLGHHVVWLIIGAFVLGGALTRSGLAGRFAAAVLGRARTVGGTCWLLTAAIVPLAFVIPSTSGRAAVLLPVQRTLAAALEPQPGRLTRALSLLVPTIVLVSTVATLVGATSHLVAVDLLHRATGESIGYAAWALWGVPFAIVASIVSALAVQLMFLRGDERRRPVAVGRPAPAPAPFARHEKVAGAVMAFTLAGWLTEPLHGLDIATVTVAAALVLMAPGVGVLTWKQGLAEVSWSMVLFVAGALALGGALVDSGGGEWIVAGLVEFSGIATLTSPYAVVTVLALLAVTAHLYVTSHTVRATALVPPFLYLAAVTGWDPIAVVFLLSVGLDYCLTLPVSSKALLLFAESGDAGGFRPRDLLRLSMVLAPAYIALMIVFYATWWSHTGLAL